MKLVPLFLLLLGFGFVSSNAVPNSEIGSPVSAVIKRRIHLGGRLAVHPKQRPQLIDVIDSVGNTLERFEDRNGDGRVDRSLSWDDKGLKEEGRDRNHDGKEDWVAKRSSVSKTGEWQMSLREDAHYEGNFKEKGSFSINPIQFAGISNIDDLSKLEPIGEYAPKSEALKKKQSELEQKLNLKIDGRCADRKEILNAFLSELTRGAACLNKLDTGLSRLHLAKMEALLSGEKEVAIFCEDLQGAGASAMGPGTKEYPTIRLDRRSLRARLDSPENEGILFHEVFHLLDPAHDHFSPSFPDYTTSCEGCCFRHQGYLRKGADWDAHCQVCGGAYESAMDINYISLMLVDLESAHPPYKHAEKLFARYLADPEKAATFRFPKKLLFKLFSDGDLRFLLEAETFEKGYQKQLEALEEISWIERRLRAGGDPRTSGPASHTPYFSSRPQSMTAEHKAFRDTFEKYVTDSDALEKSLSLLPAELERWKSQNQHPSLDKKGQ